MRLDFPKQGPTVHYYIAKNISQLNAAKIPHELAIIFNFLPLMADWLKDLNVNKPIYNL